jgi:hypothetical protein
MALKSNQAGSPKQTWQHKQRLGNVDDTTWQVSRKIRVWGAQSAPQTLIFPGEFENFAKLCLRIKEVQFVKLCQLTGLGMRPSRNR